MTAVPVVSPANHQWLPSALNRFALLIGAIAALLNAVPILAQTVDSLVLVRTIPLPDVRGRIDHLAIDPAGGRLFVAALGNDSVEVIDFRAGQWIARIPDMREPQGMAFVADPMRLFVANGRSGSVDVFDAALAPIGHFDSLPDADNIRYDPAGKRVYVGFGSALAVIDAAAMTKLADIKLAGHPEAFHVDATGSRIYVNVPSARQVAVIDRLKGTALGTWNLGDKRGNFPMAFDEAAHRLFVATRQPAALLVYDAVKGTRVADVPACGDADDIFFDGDARRLYIICGDGVVDVVQQSDADHYSVNGQVRTARGARTGLFVPTQRTLYVAVPAQRSAPAEILVYQTK